MTKINSDAKDTYERIMSLPLDPKYKPVPNIPIPTKDSILIRKLTDEELRSEGGLIVARAANSQEPSLGIIMAVGPECFDWLRVGLRCYYDCRFNDSTFLHDKVNYIRLDHYGVFFIVPDPRTIDAVGVKDPKQVFNEKKQPKQQRILDQEYRNDQNEKDQKKDKNKGKRK